MSTGDFPPRSQIVKTFGKEVPPFIEGAAALGWKVVFNSTKTSITLVSPVRPDKKIHLSSRNKGRSIDRFYKMVVKHSDPEMVKAAQDMFDKGTLRRLFPGQSDTDALEAAESTFQLSGAIQMFETGEVMEDEPKSPKKVAAAPTPVPKAVEQKVKKERHIVSERPHLMHKSLTSKGGKSYPSKTTVERRWSDGTVDYACAVSTCDKTSDSHLSFRGSHWAMHVRKGEAEPYDEKEARKTVVEDPSYTEHAWSRKASIRAKRTEQLANLLKGIDLTKITPEELAEQIVEFLGDSGTGGGAGSAPLTDAEVLDRIRALVDRGVYADQEQAIHERDQQIEDLMSYAESREAELHTELAEAKQRAAKAEGTLEAFKELVNEVSIPGGSDE